MKFYSGTTGWCLLWEICHLSSAVGNKVSLGVGFFLSGSIDWRTDDLKRPLGRLKRGHGKEWQWKQPSNHLLHTGLPAASASHSNSCNITVGIVQNLLQLYVRDLMLFFCIFLYSDSYLYTLAAGSSSVSAPTHSTAHHWWVGLCHNEHTETAMAHTHMHRHSECL